MDEDDLGVIDITKAEIESSSQKICNGNPMFCDYSDSTSTIVQYIRKDRRISHDHPSLLFLKRANPEDILPEMWDYAEKVNSILRGQYSLDFFLHEYEEKIRPDSQRG